MTRPPRKYLIVSIHDVAPPFRSEVEEALGLLDEAGVVKSSLLVVPRFHGEDLRGDRELLSLLRRRAERGDEIVLHGLEHRQRAKSRGLVRGIKRALFTRGEGEFLGIDAPLARGWIYEGLEILKSCGFSPRGFIAPAWLIERRLFPVIRERGLDYTTLAGKIVDLRTGAEIGAPTVVLKGSSRNMSRLSRFLFNHLIRLNHNARVMRVAVHPVDLRYKAQTWYREILVYLMRDRKPLSYIEFLQSTSDY